MTKRLLPFLLALPLFLLAACDSQDGGLTGVEESSSAAQPQTSSFDGSYDVSDRHLVLLKGNARKFEQKVENLDGEIVSLHEDVGFAIVRGLSDDAAAELKNSKSVAELQRDATFSLETVNQAEPGATTDALPQSATNPSTAFFYPRQQWHFEAINADEAWDAGRLGSEGVTVAILDSGIDYQNLDLAGLVDLDRSVSFVPSDDALVEQFFPGRDPVTDLYFHGTVVGATVASNAIVGAGVTSQTTLTAVKVCSVLGTCSFGAVTEGVLYAANHGADVINMSLGGGFSKAGNGRFVGFINNVFNAAKKADATVVVSAGNDGADLQHNGNTFASYCDAPHVVCVSATGPTDSESVTGPWTNVDAPAPYTNFGRGVISVAAPGGTTSGPVWGTCSQTSLVVPICQTGNYILGVTGTSFSAPHVSGLAALLVADGASKPSQVKVRLRQSADDLGEQGTDPFYGKGRIDVAAALGL